MTQSNLLGVVPRSSGANVRANLNVADQALASDSAGTSAPAVTYPYLRWRHTSALLVYRRNAGNTAWEIIENDGATTDPGPTDDSADGYGRGARWINTSSGQIFFCTDATAGAAQWAAINDWRGRNVLINGAFDVWQRGTSFSPGAGLYTADRWIAAAGTGGTAGVARGSFATGTMLGADHPKHYLQFAQSGAASSNPVLAQRIENVRTCAAQTVTLSFWASATAPLTLPSIAIAQVFGTGGSPSATVIITIASDVAVTSDWARFRYTFTLPSISGKTLGSNDDDHLQLSISFPTGATFTFVIWGVQLEIGPAARPVTRRPLAEEIALCQRYFETSYASGSGPGAADPTDVFMQLCANVANGAYVGITVPFKVPKRTTPTLTAYTIPGTAGSGTVAGSARTMVLGGNNKFLRSIQNTSGVTWSDQAPVDFHWVADAEL